MLVDVRSDCDGRMPELLLHHLERHSRSKSVGSPRVAGTMQSEAGELQTALQAIETSRHLSRSEGRSVLSTENEVQVLVAVGPCQPFFDLSDPMSPKHVEGFPVEVEHSSGLSGLRF